MELHTDGFELRQGRERSRKGRIRRDEGVHKEKTVRKEKEKEKNKERMIWKDVKEKN